MFGETINLLFRPVPTCVVETATAVPCADVYQMQADSMRDKSFELAIYWGCHCLRLCDWEYVNILRVWYVRYIV